MPRTKRRFALEVTRGTVRISDEIDVGGHRMKVRNVLNLSGGAKRLAFTTGETLTMHPKTRLTAYRAAPGWAEPCS
ncbi:hypothetical protein [Streptomyces sp. AA1529]|uniref:hypothetical protein n=1 Tax=Streptomyces sp. AA1529 TaxID=1203257 RepID=UPI0002E0B877|nr:hypothetical protein [Streptomyces sp. AA1529]